MVQQYDLDFGYDDNQCSIEPKKDGRYVKYDDDIKKFEEVYNLVSKYIDCYRDNYDLCPMLCTFHDDENNECSLFGSVLNGRNRHKDCKRLF